MAIRIVARDHFKTECVEDALKLIKELVSLTRTEKGNILYTYCQDTSTPDTFAMFEVWESQEAMASHLASEHFTRIIPQLAEKLAEPTRLETYNELI